MREYKPKSEERREMWTRAGWRERYAMKNGNARKVCDGGRVLVVFTYSKFDNYQDANGATWDTTRRAWIG